MTNKEAKRILQFSICIPMKTDEQREAINLAIKALEDVEEWRKLTAVCAFDGYVVYKERSEVSDIGMIEGYCDTCKHNGGYPASDICQGCKEFDHYERKDQTHD